MAKNRKVPEGVKRFAIASLRRASLRWPPRNIARKRARISRGKYKCEICGGIFGRKETNLDHVIPVVDVTGWENFDVFITRLFCDAENFQVICQPCHNGKSLSEGEVRTEIKNVKSKKLV